MGVLKDITSKRKTVLIEAMQNFLLKESLDLYEGKRDRGEVAIADARLIEKHAKETVKQYTGRTARVRESGMFHPSQISGCLRAIYLDMTGAKTEKPYDAVATARMLSIFSNGDYTHLRLQNLLERMGVLTQSEIPLEDKRISVEGHADGIVCVDGKKYVLEIKSINERGFLSLQDAKEAHKEQANLYMHCLNIPKAVILYENKNCVPLTAKILTLGGWKYAEKLKVGEQVLTYSLCKKCLEWQPLQQVTILKHKGKMQCIQDKHSRYVSTLMHRWPVENYKGKQEVVLAENLNSSKWLLNVAKYRDFPQKSILSVRAAFILGLVASEGHFGHSSGIEIYQKSGRKNDVIRKILGKGARHHFYCYPPHCGMHRYDLVQGELRHRLNSLCCRTKKKLPEIVTKLSKNALVAFYKGCMLGDGSWTSVGTHEQFDQRDGAVKEAFQIACFLLEKRMHINKDKVCSYIGVRKRTRVLRSKLSLIDWDDKVWCPTTANQTWVMEQEGKVVITGNCQIWKEFVVDFDKTLFEEQKSRIAKVQKALKNKVPPPRLEDPADCKWCNYKDSCRVADSWSKFPQKSRKVYLKKKSSLAKFMRG